MEPLLMSKSKKRDGSKRKNKKRVTRIDRQVSDISELNWEHEYEKFQRRKKKDPKHIRDMYDEEENVEKVSFDYSGADFGFENDFIYEF